MNEEDNITDSIKKAEDELKNSYEHIKLMVMEMRLQFDTMAETQKEERIELQKIHTQEKSVLLEHSEKLNKRLHYVIMGLIATVITICVIFFSIAIYVASNYDLGAMVKQDISTQSGNLNVFDGIHYTNGS